MIQENVTLILFFILVIISLCIFFYYDKRRQKAIAETQFDILYNQIAKEKILKEYFKSEGIKLNQSEYRTKSMIKNIHVEIFNINFTLTEIFKSK